MDATVAKQFIDALLAYAEAKSGNPIVKIVEREANVILDDLVEQFLASASGQQFLNTPKS